MSSSSTGVPLINGKLLKSALKTSSFENDLRSPNSARVPEERVAKSVSFSDQHGHKLEQVQEIPSRRKVAGAIMMFLCACIVVVIIFLLVQLFSDGSHSV